MGVAGFLAARACEYKKGVCGDDAKWHYDIWSPAVAGSYPIMVFITGGGGIAPGFSYEGIGKLMAEKGMVVTMLSRLAAPQPKTDADLESKALTWLEDNVNTMGLTATANFDQLVLSGHSAGNHVFCNLLVNNCGNGKAKAAVMMDPVDGFDPFGVYPDFCVTPGKKVNFDTPALLLRTGLDPVVKKTIACAPDKLSNDRFYNAWSGPIWMINATDYGHLGVNDPGTAKMGDTLCADSSADKSVYHEHVADMVDAFVSLVFKGNSAGEEKMTDTASMKVAAEVVKDYNGHSAPFAPGCKATTIV